MNTSSFFKKTGISFACILFFNCSSTIAQDYKGRYFSGSGDTSYLHLLDQAYRMIVPDPELENLSMLYKPSWNGFSEGPTWYYWWIQNSFGPTYTLLPFMDRAFQQFIFNSQALWFNLIGNGIRKDNNNFVGPVGVLMDCARDSPSDYYCKQGDYNVKIHDWPFGFTTAGILLQSELLLVRRNHQEIAHYIPLLETCAGFVDSRRDTINNMFLVGTAANLLAPSYNGSGKILPDSTYEKAYLAEISVNFIAALSRLIELEKFAGRQSKAGYYVNLVSKIKKGLRNFITPEGYFVRSIDPDGTKHGVFGADEHGYFETTPNQDAMAFRVADDLQSKKIYSRIKSIPGLRPYNLILPNYPGYDDMYDTAQLFEYGGWVNGGHWTTCEARMQLGYYRVGAYEDAAAAFKQILKRAYDFRLDNPLKDFGAKEYQPDIPVNCVYDSWGAPGGFLRGLFEYRYTADGISIYPHIPSGIDHMVQHFPVYFGNVKIYISTTGSGNIHSVLINRKPYKVTGKDYIHINPRKTDKVLYISIALGNSQPDSSAFAGDDKPFITPAEMDFWNINLIREKEDSLLTTDLQIDSLKKTSLFYQLLLKENLAETYEAAHAKLILISIKNIQDRRQKKKEGLIKLMPANRLIAADQLYIDAIIHEVDGLAAHIFRLKDSADPQKKHIRQLWEKAFD